MLLFFRDACCSKMMLKTTLSLYLFLSLSHIHTPSERNLTSHLLQSLWRRCDHQHCLSAVCSMLWASATAERWAGGGMLISGSSISKDPGIIVLLLDAAAVAPPHHHHCAAETELVTRESLLPGTHPQPEKPNTQPACWWWFTQIGWQAVSSPAARY